MTLVFGKNHLGDQILYKSADVDKKRRHGDRISFTDALIRLRCLQFTSLRK